MYDSMPPAYPYVPPQQLGKRYSNDVAIIRGTLFPELDLPFHGYEIPNTLPKTLMTEAMELSFVCHELKLYLDTHPEDTATLDYYNHCKQKADAANQALQDELNSCYYNSWVYSPWPWEGEV